MEVYECSGGRYVNLRMRLYKFCVGHFEMFPKQETFPHPRSFFTLYFVFCALQKSLRRIKCWWPCPSCLGHRRSFCTLFCVFCVLRKSLRPIKCSWPWPSCKGHPRSSYNQILCFVIYRIIRNYDAAIFNWILFLKVTRSGNFSLHFRGVYNLILNSHREGICGHPGFPIK